MLDDGKRLPDFIIIGAMKSATSTLQEQLAGQPGIYMSEPKEPNYFSDEKEFARGLDWYKNLFSPADKADILGEASTHYTKLPVHPHTVSRLKLHVPQARFIYVMRHPVDRLVSHYIHEWSMGVYNCDINSAVQRYPELVAYGQYAMQLQPYFDVFGQEAVLPVFFDRLVSQPEKELQRVCRFINYGKQPLWIKAKAASNVSSERIRRFPLYDLLVESRLATFLRRTLVPGSWRNNLKSKMQMKQRPEIDESVLAELEARFDDDLDKLGRWVGRSLTCSNFKQCTAETELNWVVQND